ncbi:MAG: AAA family ATPase [Deltaproteobacteria bacterium]|nr:AAA family ATPase [Deltaproteobacteria bacterium]
MNTTGPNLIVILLLATFNCHVAAQTADSDQIKTSAQSISVISENDTSPAVSPDSPANLPDRLSSESSGEAPENPHSAGTRQKRDKEQAVASTPNTNDDTAPKQDIANKPDDTSQATTIEAKKRPPQTLDPILVDIEKQLKMLVGASLPESVDIQMLFDVPLDDIDKVENRIQQLKLERVTLRSSRSDKQRRLRNLTTEFPLPEKPEILNTPPVEPPPPIEPVAPEKPEVKRPRGKLTPKRPQQWQDAYTIWQTYDEALAQHQLAMTEYEQEMAFHAEQIAKHDEAVVAYEAAKLSFENALNAHKKKLQMLNAELAIDLQNIGLRSRILSLRLKYLDALHSWLKPLTAPARMAFRGLKLTRKSLVNSIESSRQLSVSLEESSNRLEAVANRAEAGAMSGFQIKLSQLAADLKLLADAVRQRSAKINAERRTLQRLRIDLRGESASVRRLVIANVLNPHRDKLIDDAFLKYLEEMRRASKNWFTKEVDGNRISQLMNGFGRIAANPQDVSSWSDGATILNEVKPLLEKLDVQIDELGLVKAQQRQIFRRESVSLLSNLATDKTRRIAYSFSQEILSDISSDAHTLADTLLKWAKARQVTIVKIPEMIHARQGIVFLVRVLLAITLIILIGLLGRRLSRLVSMGISRFSRSVFFRHRLGQLVKWAGVAESILPTLVVGATLYAALAIVGFSVPEVKFVEVILRWLVIYILGGRLLEGLTRRVSRGRPAFIPVSVEVAEMLSGTYKKLGLVVALAAVVLEWTANWFGSGILHNLIVYTLFGWLCLWGTWVLFVWRPVVAGAVAKRYALIPERPVARLKSSVVRTSQWMSKYRVGAILTAPAVLLLLLDWFYRQIRFLLYEGGIVTFFRARLIRRLVNTQKRNSVLPSPRTLPEQYTHSFPLYPIYDEEDAVLLPRKQSIESIVLQIERWKITRQDSSLVLLGEKGIGKTTMLTLLEQQLRGNVLRYSISRKLKTEKALAAEFATMLGMDENTQVIGAIAAQLNQGDERVILIDEGHNVFLRTIDGYEAYEALIRLVNVTAQNVFWVLVFNTFSFAFLNASRNRLHYFRKLHFLPTWTRDDLTELISKRNRQTGFDVEFDELLLDANRSSSGDFEVIEGAEGFFRLLWENSGGNPRVATCLWLDALTALGDNKIRVGIFSETLATELSKMDTELLYALAAICQHENLSVSELREALNVTIDFANFAIRFLTEYGLVEPKHTDARRHTLAPRFYPQVIRLLRSHHLLYEKE